VDIIAGYCEVGTDCLPECPHSYPAEKEHEVAEIFRREYDLLEDEAAEPSDPTA